MSASLKSNQPTKTIWVFRTSVASTMDIRRIKPFLDAVMQKGDKWNFDLEDCDHILRVETHSLAAFTIIHTMKQAGFACAELEDNISKEVVAKNSDSNFFPEMKAAAG